MSDDDEKQITCTLLWKDVTLPPDVTAEDLDEVIFSKLKPTWLKMARIVHNTASAFESRTVSVDYDIVGARIRALAEDGRIESQGDLSKWRFSEVRLSPLRN